MRTLHETLQQSMLARAGVGLAASGLVLAAIGVVEGITTPPNYGDPSICPRSGPAQKPMKSVDLPQPERAAQILSRQDYTVQNLAALTLESLSWQCMVNRGHQEYATTTLGSGGQNAELSFSLRKEVPGSKVPGTTTSVYELSFTVPAREVHNKVVDPKDIESFVLKESAYANKNDIKDVATVAASRDADQAWTIHSSLAFSDGHVQQTGGEASKLSEDTVGPMAMANFCVQGILRNSANGFEAQLSPNPHASRSIAI